MKLKEKEAQKALSVTELKSALLDAEQRRFKLNFKHSVTPVKNALELRSLRRDIARLRTWIRQKELAK